MNVRQLIEELGKMPPSAEVLHLWDGVARTNIEHVWLARTGIVVTADFDEVSYMEGDRPKSVPEGLAYWRTPKKS